ncbi:MAG TPA: zinc ABC transporter substrate-binding protein [Actinomycetota bacterium]
MTRVQHRTRYLPIIGVGTALMLAAVACTSSGDTADGASDDSEPITVATAFYPLAAAAEAVGGDCVEVVNLTPPGVEPHDLELTPDDVEAIGSADLILYLGSGFQPAVEDSLGDAQGRTVDILTLVDTAPAPPSESEEGLLVDPHVWLDPGLWAEAVQQIPRVMADVAPHASCDFSANARSYGAELSAIDEEFTTALNGCQVEVIVTNHAAFGYLASAYGLTQEAISGLEPDAEPTPARLAELKDLVDANGVTTIFSEDLVSPEVAQTLADEADVDTATLNTLEGLTPEQVDAGEDYASVMRTNLDTLEASLGCS